MTIWNQNSKPRYHHNNFPHLYTPPKQTLPKPPPSLSLILSLSMVLAMHAKSDSDATSVSSPPRPLYFVQSPSHHDENNSSSFFSPPPHFYNVHHSRDSSRFSSSLLKSSSRAAVVPGGAWRKLYARELKDNYDDDVDDEEEDGEVVEEEEDMMRFYVGCFLVCFVALFTVFSLILWAAASTYPPKIHVQGMVFRYFNVHQATDHNGVATNMLNLNSTVTIFYRNPATFFGVHVSSTPLELHYYQKLIASGEMKKFYQSRKSQRHIVTSISAKELTLYGSIPIDIGQNIHPERVKIPLNLTFVIRSRAYVLGRLVKPTFYRKIRCEFTFRKKHMGKPVKRFADLCSYDE